MQNEGALNDKHDSTIKGIPRSNLRCRWTCIFGGSDLRTETCFNKYFWFPQFILSNPSKIIQIHTDYSRTERGFFLTNNDGILKGFYVTTLNSIVSRPIGTITNHIIIVSIMGKLFCADVILNLGRGTFSTTKSPFVLL